MQEITGPIEMIMVDKDDIIRAAIEAVEIMKDTDVSMDYANGYLKCMRNLRLIDDK